MGAATPLSYDSGPREESQMNERYTFTQTETRQLKEMADLVDAVAEEPGKADSSSVPEGQWGPQGTTTTDRDPPGEPPDTSVEHSPRTSRASPSRAHPQAERAPGPKSSAHTLEASQEDPK